MLIKMIARSADAGPGGWVGLKRKLLHLDVDGSGAVNAEGERVIHALQALIYQSYAQIVVKNKQYCSTFLQI